MKTFRGGVHPADMKAATCHKPIVNLDPPDELIFPLSQHIGAPAIPLVKKGDAVLMGQKIAEASGFVSANIHASVSGTVKAIEKRLHPNGTMVDCIVIENDHQDTPVSDFSETERYYTELSSQEIIDLVREAGIVGMGGAAFPAHIKLSPPKDATIDYVIINGAECEPYLTSDHRAMLENAKTILRGLAIVLQLFNLEEGYIAIESNKPDAIAHMREAAADFPVKKIHIVPLKTKYPQGSEKQLINAVTGRKLKPGQLPWQAGCIVTNIDTAAAIARAVIKHIPLTTRIVTLGGDAIKNPMNFRARLGTPFRYAVEQSGGLLEAPQKVLMGGPMMGTAVPNLDVPIIKGTSGILCFGKASAHLEEETSCLRCSKCLYVCPMNLQPNLLDSLSRRDDFEKLSKLNITDCIECGSCAFICPARRRQVQQIRIAKIKMRNAQAKEN